MQTGRRPASPPTSARTQGTGPTRPIPSERSPFLRVLNGEEAGRLIPLPAEEIVLGRSEEVAIPLAGHSVSRRHARLEQAGEREMRLVDLGSRNGTWVRGERVQEASLHDGDVFSPGGMLLLRLAWYDEEEVSLVAALHARAPRDPVSGLPRFAAHAAAWREWPARPQGEVAAALVAPLSPLPPAQWYGLGELLARGTDLLVAQWDDRCLAVLALRGRFPLQAALDRLGPQHRVGAVEASADTAPETLMEAAASALDRQVAAGITWSLLRSPPLPATDLQPSSRERARIAVCCLGRGVVSLDGVPIADAGFHTQKVKWLLVHLVTGHGGAVSDEELIACYWPGSGTAGRKSLNTAVSFLRKAMGRTHADAIVRCRGFVGLKAEVPAWSDLVALETHLAHAAGRRRSCGPAAAIPMLRSAVALYRGPFLAGCPLDWAVRIRNATEARVIGALCELAAAELDDLQAEAALEHAMQAAELSPGCQEAHHLVMRAHARLGSPQRALRHLARCTRILEADFGVPPALPLVEEALRIRLGLDAGALP